MSRLTLRLTIGLCCGLVLAGLIVSRTLAVPAPQAASAVSRERLQSQLRDLIGNPDESLASIDDMYRNDQRLREGALANQAGLKSALQAMEQRITELSAQADKIIKEDYALADLKKAVDSRINYNKMVEASHTASQAELENLIVVVAQLEVAMADRHDLMPLRFNVGELTEFRQQQVQATTRLKAAEAEIAYLDGRLATLRQARAIAQQLEPPAK